MYRLCNDVRCFNPFSRGPRPGHLKSNYASFIAKFTYESKMLISRLCKQLKFLRLSLRNMIPLSVSFRQHSKHKVKLLKKVNFSKSLVTCIMF